MIPHAPHRAFDPEAQGGYGTCAPWPERGARADRVPEGGLVLVTGLAGGREVFLGRVTGETAGDLVTVEGKAIARGADGALVVRPFATTCAFPARSTEITLQRIADEDAQREAADLLHGAGTALGATTHPLLARWIAGATGASAAFDARRGAAPGTYDDFTQSAARFRRALLTNAHVTSATELDQLAEIEGATTIAVARAVGRTAARFHALLAQHADLGDHLEAVFGRNAELATGGDGPAGWHHVLARLDAARGWSRRNGRTQLVRDVDQLLRDGVDALSAAVLEGCTQIDVLVAEAFNQHGVTPEAHAPAAPARGAESAAAPRRPSGAASAVSAFAGAGLFTGSVA